MKTIEQISALVCSARVPNIVYKLAPTMKPKGKVYSINNLDGVNI
jgi:hypothetical protein